ncbi:MAG: Acyl carrier protein [Bacteroidetes bacterium]|jgi:acyl carrier protein|nr:Acyl carrier protein [Bacteroidota bacterium]
MPEPLLQQLQEVFRNVFENSSLIITDATNAADIHGWDSLTHMHLLHRIEEQFRIRFSFNEVSAFENVGDIVKTLQKKI